MFVNPRIGWISSIALVVIVWMLSYQAVAQLELARPRTTNQRLPAKSVILGEGTHAATMQRLHVVRQYSFSAVRANPQLSLGDARLDFTPMLNNPKALMNVAQRLHEMPQHVQVQEESSEVDEVDQGLVIHHVLSYRILPGKCADAGVQSQLARAGIGCFARASMSERLGEFSTPGSPRYVADPTKRQEAIAAFRRNNTLADADAVTSSRRRPERTVLTAPMFSTALTCLEDCSTLGRLAGKCSPL